MGVGITLHAADTLVIRFGIGVFEYTFVVGMYGGELDF